MDDTRRIPASQPLFTALTDAFVEGEAGTTYDPHPDPLWLTPGPDARVACEPGQGLTAAAISSRRPVPLVSWASTSVGRFAEVVLGAFFRFLHRFHPPYYLAWLTPRSLVNTAPAPLTL